MVGHALFKQLKGLPNSDIIVKERSELDLINQSQVLKFFETEKPTEVIIAAAKLVGYMQMKHIQQNLFTKIYKFKIMLLIQLTYSMYKNYYF